MNCPIRQQTLSKAKLERMCLSNLRMLAGSHHIERVVVVERKNAQRNWTVLEITPPLSAAADNEARNVLAELQEQFRLAD